MNKTTPSKPSALPSSRHNAPPEIVYVPTDSLKLDETDTRGFTDRDLKRTRRVVGHFQMPLPLLVGKEGTVLAGQLLWLAAVANKAPEVPVVEVRNLSRLEERMLAAALARVGELGKWKQGKQRALLVEIMDELPAFDLENLAFDMGEIDVILEPEEEDERDGGPVGIDAIAVTKLGDIFQLGRHRIGCGDATDLLFYGELMAGAVAAGVFTDPPYGMKIAGFASTNRKRREFVQGSGDMDEAALAVFAQRYCEAIAAVIKPGAVVYLCMDWRGIAGLIEAARPVFGEPINLAVWKKNQAGMGSFLRSQHELIPIFAKPGGKRRNNVELGRNGRSRTNVWEYPSASAFGKSSEEGNMLAIHATPKPVKLVADAILDSTARGDIVLDPFLGSGTTLVAAEKVGRVCYGMDLDPVFVDAGIRRLQTWTGLDAVHVASGKTFGELEAEAIRDAPKNL